MARWGKNIVVPLDSLIKEKENTNRPVAARSAGTVGKWGKMGFTSTRTYAAFKAFPSTINSSVIDTTATATTNAEGLNSLQNNTQTTNDPPKPKKFFKSRNSTVDIIRTQIIQHLPRAPPSPIREIISPTKNYNNSTIDGTFAVAAAAASTTSLETSPSSKLKLKIPKAARERKKSVSTEKVIKPKKKKEEKKKLKPEAPPSRVISRQRKVVNYNEDDEEDERNQTPHKNVINVPKTLTNREVTNPLQYEDEDEEEENQQQQQQQQINHFSKQNNSIVECDKEATSNAVEEDTEFEHNLEEPPIIEPPPPVTPKSNAEHPPIVLRISKGTSRLISTDSEEVINSPVQQSPVIEQQPPPPVTITSTEELLSVLSGEPPSLNISKTDTEEKQLENLIAVNNSMATTESEINKSNEMKSPTSSIEPQVQKHESLKIVIKTDVLKNAFITDKSEKKTRNRKRKKGGALTNAIERHPTTPSPSPKLLTDNRTLMSPPPQSEKDFDSQSSVLGSISSKGTNQFPSVIADDNCVIRSRGSSDITSDLETSQHSSLVAPPSDIESRLESMMDCDDDLPPLDGVDSTAFGGVDNKLTPIQEEPLKEDILQVLTGGDVEEEIEKSSKSNIQTQSDVLPVDNKEIHKEPENVLSETTINEKSTISTPITEIKTTAMTKRMTRSRKGKTTIDETTAISSVEEPVITNKSGRVTRNNNNGNFKNNANILPPSKSYSRKRKNAQQSSPEIPPSQLEVQEQQQQQERIIEANNTSNINIDLPDAPHLPPPPPPLFPSSLASSEISEISTLQEKTNDHENDQHKLKTEEKQQYKIKSKLKRTWYERDSKTLEDNENCPGDNEPIRKKFNNSTECNDESNSLVTSNNNNNTKNSNSNDGSPVSPLSNFISNDDEKQPSVKLVISKKKGSIFKSRALVANQGGETKRAVYKHTWDDEKEKSTTNTPTPSDSGDTVFDDEFSNDTAAVMKFSRLTRQNVTAKFEDEEPITSVKCDRKAKEYYTVVRNVKTAHQIQEIGEYQEMKDDVDYILDALQPHNPISTRCLSALQLATKCCIPAFRMHVRAHGTVGKFFKALKDAKHDLSLGLCTATIMFVLSQDTLNIDLDKDSLELMINLLEIDMKKNSSSTLPDDSENAVTYERNKQKVRELCEDLKNQGKATHLNLDQLSTDTLAMETLLSLTSKKAGEWFKEELRELGGLEHIIKTICNCCYQISDYVVSWTEILLDKLKTIERCLRVLENISQQNEKNQNYILSYNSGYAIDTLFKLYKLCDSEIALYPTNDLTPKDNPGVVLREALVPTLKVLINLTHPFDNIAIGSKLLGQRAGIFDTSFHILLQAPNYVPERCIFELSILVLLLLINLTMYTIQNRQLIMKAHAPSDFGNQFDKIPAIKALIEYFYRCQEQAQLAEQNTDEILENPESNTKKKPQSQEEMDETVTKLLQKAGHHMEHTLQASYAGILIGHLISENSENETIIRSYLRDHKFHDIVNILEKYYTFMNLTASSEATMVSHIKSTKNLIDYFKKCDSHSNSDDNSSDNLNQQKQQRNYGSSNNNSSNGSNSDLITSQTPSSSTSSISTRSATTRYYKSYSQR